jgi:hypothetical protein
VLCKTTGGDEVSKNSLNEQVEVECCRFLVQLQVLRGDEGIRSQMQWGGNLMHRGPCSSCVAPSLC